MLATAQSNSNRSITPVTSPAGELLVRYVSVFRSAGAKFSVLIEAYGQLHVKTDKQRRFAVESRVNGGG
jgi:hypothetical protein